MRGWVLAVVVAMMGGCDGSGQPLPAPVDAGADAARRDLERQTLGPRDCTQIPGGFVCADLGD